MHTLRGACHCGRITVAFETALDPRALPIRACQCSFCRRHGGVTTSDPAGRLVVEVADAEQLQRYRFALGITDFLLCKTCGVYVAATMEQGGALLGVLNVNVLDEREAFARAPSPMEYGAESVEQREARRARAWMPVELRGLPRAAQALDARHAPVGDAVTAQRSVGGACLCGEVAFELEGPILEFELDHCSRCRKLTGSAFASEIQVASESFRWLRGRDGIRVYRAPIVRSPPAYERWFCPSCGGPVPREVAGVVLVPAGLLDADPVARPERHIFVGVKAPWLEIHDHLPQFATKP